MKTLLIDNYDSFTYNLSHYLAVVSGESPIVVRNDELSWESLKQLDFDNIVISPGPGTPLNPKDLGLSRDAVQQCDIPVLGVCLGHQAIAHVHGAEISLATEPVHGRVYTMMHANHLLFKSIPEKFDVVRYHSLIVQEPLPQGLEGICWTEDGLLMGIAATDRPHWGVQFHPESICSEYGMRLLLNFNLLSERYLQQKKRTARKLSATLPEKKLISETKKVSECLCVKYRELDFAVNSEAVFLALYGNSPHAFWLDSSMQKAGLSRYSFMGDDSGPLAQLIQYQSDSQRLKIADRNGARIERKCLFDFLKQQLQRYTLLDNVLDLPFKGGLVGYFGYELKQECGGEQMHKSELPDAAFILTDRYIAIDAEKEKIWLVALEQTNDAAASSWFDRVTEILSKLEQPAPPALGNRKQRLVCKLTQDKDEYCQNILRAQEEIRNGETYEVCLTNRVNIDVDVEPLTLYRTLRRINPAPYASFLRFSDFSIVCSSPERFLTIDANGRAESKPIKGTIRRGSNEDEDRKLAEILRTCEKDRSENLMIVDLVRNDLGRVSQAGSVKVPKLMQIESFATVHQLVSTIESRLAVDKDAIDCIKAAFPGGSMTGAPKIRTLQIIDKLESSARGVYSGAIGYLSFDGAVDLNIVIRTMVIQKRKVTLGTGGAIIALSDAEMEFEEILLKSRALLKALSLHVCGVEDHFVVEGIESLENQEELMELEVF